MNQIPLVSFLVSLFSVRKGFKRLVCLFYTLPPTLSCVLKLDASFVAPFISCATFSPTGSQTLQNRSKCVSGEKYEAIKSCEPCTEYEKVKYGY